MDAILGGAGGYTAQSVHRGHEVNKLVYQSVTDSFHILSPSSPTPLVHTQVPWSWAQNRRGHVHIKNLRLYISTYPTPSSNSIPFSGPFQRALEPVGRSVTDHCGDVHSDHRNNNAHVRSND